jgi:hypothetical protein
LLHTIPYLRLEALSGLELQRRSVCLKGGLGALGGDRVMGEILFALPLLGAPALADSDVHARIVPFFLANDIIRHCTLL